MKDRVWILLPEKDAKAPLTEALELGFDTFVTPGDTRELEGLARIRLLRLDEAGLHAPDGVLVARRLRIRSVEEQDAALALAGTEEAFLVDATDWRIIPYENLIAAYRRKGTRLLALANDAQDAKLLLETLETGVDAVLLPARHARAAGKLLQATLTETLVEARVTAVRPVGTGDRACLDTASMLTEEEGVLVGSAAGGLFLVASEARESGYVASRPFRVNAGPVHAYVMGPGGRTRYLSELKAGDEVLVCDRQGHTRTAVLGRVKIERRPLLLIEAETDEGKRVGTLVQNAETIRLATSEGTKSVVDLTPGDRVLVRVDAVGRHFGMPVDETLVER